MMQLPKTETTLVHIKSLKKTFNNTFSLAIDDLRIDEGEIIGLVGNNGAGKTTLLRLMLDLLKADRGAVEFRGKDVASTEEWKSFTSAYIDDASLIDFLTVEEYFEFICQCYSIDNDAYKARLQSILPISGGELLGQKKYIRDYSSGNRQKIGIMGALLTSSSIVILDEPFNFLDPSSQLFLQDYLKQLNKSHKNTILLSSHNIDQVCTIASRILVMDHGKIIKDIKEVNEHTKQELNTFFLSI